ncbi:cyclin-dependent kinase inhibitor 3 isoform X8 [Ovis aries]|uniref:cyclin-dependent kinase inhibitor 3 isoform X8 n=1 Tax=Ovis aries TaxID=9940 RepID=UPI00295288FF|nr:cyclin-dependent kinase inhibitor 3 isoform X8 [Ovis aries]
MKPPSSMQTSEFDSSDEEPIEDEQTPIQISWLPLSRVNCSQFLGLCALPGCKFKDVRRNIQKDTEELKSYDGGTPDITSCCEIMEELEVCLKNNRKTLIQLFKSVPTVTNVCSDKEDFLFILPSLSADIARQLWSLFLRNSIRCYGGLGRSCLVAACLLLYLSDTVSPQQAIDSLRDLRGSGAIQTIKVRRVTVLMRLWLGTNCHSATRPQRGRENPKHPIIHVSPVFILTF